MKGKEIKKSILMYEIDIPTKNMIKQIPEFVVLYLGER